MSKLAVRCNHRGAWYVRGNGEIKTLHWCPACGERLRKEGTDEVSERRCPICKLGTLVEDPIGAHCSRRYAKRSPCWFEVGMCSSPDEFDAQVERFRKTTKGRAKC